MNVSCGIDFGTSNSSVAIAHENTISLVPVENEHTTIPSALFFTAGEHKAHYGRAAIHMFFSRHEGRLMRSLKRVLGTSLMQQGTLVNGKAMKFDHIIASFLKNSKAKANTIVGHEIEHVVMGRPVHFVDNDPTADTRAQAELRNIAMQIGFKNIEFQFEPIAAAFAHEANVIGEKLALVADLGGGTSDFTIIKLSNKYSNKPDRSKDILANTGIRLGGNDFDKELSLAAIMPELGYRSEYGSKKLEVPLKYFHDLAEWSKINFLYTAKTTQQVRQFLHESHDKNRLKRLLHVLEHETGHAVLATAEETKIALTTTPTHHAAMEFLEKDFSLSISRSQFEAAIRHDVHKISQSALQCVKLAGITTHAIELVILTGGSTEVPLVQSEFTNLFPKALLAGDNKLSSVGLGLAYDSKRKFG